MLQKPNSVWNEFKSEFIKVIQSLDAIQLKRLKRIADRKFVLNDYRLPSIAQKLGYNYKTEFLRIDYTFFKRGSKNKFDVPIVFIESENNFESVYEEISKLASVNADLKILIIYGMPEDRLTEFKNHENYESYIFEDFIEHSRLIGTYVILAYDDTEDKVRFHSYVFDEKGIRVESESNIIEIS